MCVLPARPGTDKIAHIRQALEQAGADCHVMTGLEDIAWTFNLRGSDVPDNPVNIAFALVEKDQVRLFIHPDKVGADLSSGLSADGIQLENYPCISSAVKELPDSARVLLDPDMMSAGTVGGCQPEMPHHRADCTGRPAQGGQEQGPDPSSA